MRDYGFSLALISTIQNHFTVETGVLTTPYANCSRSKYILVNCIRAIYVPNKEFNLLKLSEYGYMSLPFYFWFLYFNLFILCVVNFRFYMGPKVIDNLLISCIDVTNISKIIYLLKEYLKQSFHYFLLRLHLKTIVRLD